MRTSKKDQPVLVESPSHYSLNVLKIAIQPTRLLLNTQAPQLMYL